mmetsp:Transcript_133205/g.344696  ORF Transcript_133205/g.344696 Transcript_133205/m.344696 type:complete len:223 (+) Transcript_133205:494-1162(+)
MSTILCFVLLPLEVVATPTSSPTLQPISKGSCFKKSSCEPFKAGRLSNVHVRSSGFPSILMVPPLPFKKRSPRVGCLLLAACLMTMVAWMLGWNPIGLSAEPIFSSPPSSTSSQPTLRTAFGARSSHFNTPWIFKPSTVMLELKSHRSPGGQMHTSSSEHWLLASFQTERFADNLDSLLLTRLIARAGWPSKTSKGKKTTNTWECMSKSKGRLENINNGTAT